MDLITSIICIVLGVAVYAISGSYDIFTYDPVGGGGFPRLLAVVIIICGILIGIQYFLKQKKKKTEAAVEKGSQKKPLRGKPKEPLLMVASLIIYSLVMEPLGYVVSTLLLVSGLMFIQHERGVRRLVVVPVAVVAALYLIFDIVLGIKMPNGLLI
ncbi:MAG TPA: tripartite tricarboxylate transporter TctB family protein [Anaerovoracaceae bacterium]|nr:tripartite tricarboxylate transporter TctB family protein [Anaerovoracaceae bacterium]